MSDDDTTTTSQVRPQDAGTHPEVAAAPQRSSRGWWIAGIATAVVLTSLGSNAFARTELGQDVTQRVETATDRVDHGVESLVDDVDRALP